MTINLENRELYLVGLKRCSSCKEVKELSRFSQRKANWDGLRSSCKDCDRDSHQKYRSIPENYEREVANKNAHRRANPEQAINYSKRYRKENPIAVKLARRRWHLNHKDSENAKSREKVREWVNANPERHRANGRNYRARSAGAEGSHTLEQEQMLLAAFDGICPSCGSKAKLTLDHIIPLNQGGSHYVDNLQGLCKVCNSAKQDKLIIDYRPKEVRYWAFAEMSFVAIY